MDAVVAIRVPQELLETSTVQKLLDQHLACAMFGDTNTLRRQITNEFHRSIKSSHLLDDIGTELLDRQGTDVARELSNDGIAEPVVVQIEDVLDDLEPVREP